MTQSQTSPFMSSSFPYSAPMKGLTLNREKEREAARIERERLLQNVEPAPHAPLFPHPKKVQPSGEDTLQHTIQATLGDFNKLKPSMYQKQYSLLGITNKVPQTPVDAGNNKTFSFDNNLLNKKENTLDKNLAKTQKPKPLNRTKEEKPGNDSTNKITSMTKKNVDEHGKTSKTVSKKLSDTDHSLLDSSVFKKVKEVKASVKKETFVSSEVKQDHHKASVKKETSINSEVKQDHHAGKVSVKKETSVINEVKHDHKVSMKKEVSLSSEVKHDHKASVKKETSINSEVKQDHHVGKVSVKKETSSLTNGIQKSDQHVLSNGIDEKIATVKKEAKDTIIPKHKPPKLSIRSPEHSLTSNEPNVKKILEEMTQPGPPPLTAIQTPRKSNAPFAFPHNLSTSSIANGSPAATTTIKNEKEELLEDLQITDDENSDNEGNDSSDDSDSSSDSDSDSSTDNSPLNSPVRSQLNKPTKSNKLNHADTETIKKPNLPSTTKASTTTSLSDTSEGGVRGNLAAPAAHASPLANTSVNNDSTHNSLSILSDYGLEFSDISKTMMEENLSGESGGFDTALLASGITFGDEEPENHFKPIEPDCNEVKESNSVPDSLSGEEFALTTVSNPVLKVSPKEQPLVAVSPKKETTLNASVKKEPSIKKEHSHSAKKDSSKSPKVSENTKKDKPKVEPTPKLFKEKHEKTSKSSIKKKANDSGTMKSSSKSSDSKDDSKSKKIEKTVEKKSSKTKKTSRIKKPVISDDGESEDVDVVTVSNDKPLLNKTNHVDSNKQQKTENKTKSKPVNGHKESSLNGHRNSSLNGHKDTVLKDPLSPLSPKNGLDEITLDCNSKPDALVVKIPLAWLRRIPLLKSQDSFSINNKMENGNGESSPPRKAAKHHLSVECSDSKKSKYEHTNGELNGGRRHSTSSTHSEEQNWRKRSPSRDNDIYYNSKRRRHDSENSRHDDHVNGHSKMNGWSRINDSNLPQEHSEECFCGGKKEAEKRETSIAKLYDPEPRIPHGPDHYLLEAKRVKHRADAIKDYNAKAYKYFESVLSFVNCGKALEQNNDTESRSAYQMYLETIDMLKYAMRLVSSRSSQDKKVDKRFIGLCLRLQSLLYMRLFKLRKDSMLKASKTLMDHFKGQAKTAQAPSPYNASNSKMTGTPSPMSPTPSPSGSIGSVGSVGSNEAMTTPSRNSSRPSSNCMTSPVNMSIPQKVHTMMLQHLGFTNHMLYGYDAWEQSQLIFNEHREFFMDLDKNYGPITLQSSIVDVVEYMQQGYQRLQKEMQT